MWWPFILLIIVVCIVVYIIIGIIVMSQVAKAELRKGDNEYVIGGIILWPIIFGMAIGIGIKILCVKAATKLACIGKKDSP